MLKNIFKLYRSSYKQNIFRTNLLKKVLFTGNYYFVNILYRIYIHNTMIHDTTILPVSSDVPSIIYYRD